MPYIRNHNEPNRNGTFNLIKIMAKVMDLVGRNDCKLEIGILYQLNLKVN